MLKIRKMNVDDYSFAAELANTADWHMSVYDFEFMAGVEPDGCFVACQDDKRIGIATCINFGKLAWFGNLIVTERQRGKGVGTALVNHALDYLHNTNVETVGLYSVSDLTDFYGTLGFRKDIEFTVFERAHFEKTSNAMLKRVEADLVQPLVNFDAQCFGADRSKLLNALASRKDNLCYCINEKGQVKGYIIAKVFADMAEVGPLVCLGNDSAFRLLEGAISQLNNVYATICLPKRKSKLIDFLSNFGFSESFTVPRMFLGPYSAKECVYAAESLERG